MGASEAIEITRAIQCTNPSEHRSNTMKFATEDAAYLAERKALSQELGPRELWSIVDHWPLYCGVGNLARFMAIADLLRGTARVPGHVAEFGSWKGANLMF